MRSFPSGWNTVLAKLGIRRRRRSLRNQNLSRLTRFEAMEPRQMLSISVNTLADDNNGPTNGTSLREALAIAAVNSGRTKSFSRRTWPARSNSTARRCGSRAT
jgi:hypothetical protein